MVSVVLALVVCLGLALCVLALVALPARREGREVLSERGEHVVGSLRERTERSRAGRRAPGEPVAEPRPGVASGDGVGARA